MAEMTDPRGELPALAFIEAQVLHRAAEAGDLASSVRAVEREYDLSPGSLGSGVFLESRVVSLLYCLIVIPKEVWALDRGHEVFQRLGKKWSLEPVSVSLHREGFWNQPVYQFIHHLRNAVSHANFSIEKGTFEFWDQRPREEEPSFRASLSMESLQAFLEIVGATLANLRSGSAAQQPAAAGGAAADVGTVRGQAW